MSEEQFDLEEWDPNPTQQSSYADHPKVADLVGSVVASVGPQWGDEVETEYGFSTPLRLERLVVFDSRGNGQSFEDFAIWQTVLQEAMNKPVAVGRLLRPKNAYVLDPVDLKIKARVAEVLKENGWLPGTAPLPTKEDKTKGRRSQGGNKPPGKASTHLEMDDEEYGAF